MRASHWHNTIGTQRAELGQHSSGARHRNADSLDTDTASAAPGGPSAVQRLPWSGSRRPSQHRDLDSLDSYAMGTGNELRIAAFEPGRSEREVEFSVPTDQVPGRGS